MARRATRPPIGIGWIVTWPLTAVFAALVFFAAEGVRQPAKEAPAPAIGGPDWSARLPQRIAAVDAALKQTPLRWPAPVEEERGSGPLRWTHRAYELTLPAADQAKAEAAMEALRAVDPGLAITAETKFDGTEVRIGLDGLLVTTVRFRRHERPAGKPRVALVVGPLGDDLRVAREVIGLDGPVAVAVRLSRPFSREAAELARMFEHEVLIDLDPSVEALASPRQLDAALAPVPNAIGVAWRRSSGKERPDARLLAELARRKLLVIAESDARPDAQAAARVLPAVVVAADGDVDAVSGQLLAVLDRARTDGTAIGVMAPTAASIEAVRRTLAQWRTGEVEVVSVSALAAPASLSAR